MTLVAGPSTARTHQLESLQEAHDREGWLSRGAVEEASRAVGVPVAEAWEASTSYPEFRFEPPSGLRPICMGLSCAVNGAVVRGDEEARGCQFRCYEAPAAGHDQAFPETAIRVAGPLLAADVSDSVGVDSAASLGRAAVLDAIDASGLRGRGGAYFPVGRKWRAALEERRPIALVVNAEEGEPGVFKDRALLCRRPRRFLEGLAIAASVLQPTEIVVFINGEALAARQALNEALSDWPEASFGAPVRVVRGGGGYVLGEETTLLNALEGRKPVPRLRPPYPVESGYFGMPTVVNNVETIANLSIILRDGPGGFQGTSPGEAPGTKVFSVSGNVARSGVYEMPMGSTIGGILEAAGGSAPGAPRAALVGGPSGGFLPTSEFGRALGPGSVHETGAIIGAGGLVFLDETADLREAARAMARFNADESCGKCTPCREGSPRATDSLAAGATDGMEEL
ncbi:MAG: NADH-ubiquinone oxidoreductase-F iron-sulfur binding region domain-containing protein, partial [Dehalococcoidia bacterium]